MSNLKILVVKKSWILFLLLVTIFDVNAQIDDEKEIQSALMSEYQSLLTKDKFNKDRIKEIEDIALENPYYDLRQWIALSYSTKSEIRQLNAKNFKKAFEILHKSIKENFFKSIPLAIYTSKHFELRDEREEFIRTLYEKVSLGILHPAPLAELYVLNDDYDAVFNTLGPLKKKQLDILFDKNSLEVLSILPDSPVSLKKGDKVLYINDEPTSLKNIAEILSKYNTNSEQEITFKRNDELIKRNFIIPEDKFN